MRLTALVFIACVVLASAGSAAADNYGCVSKQQCRQMEKLIRATFGYGWKGDTAIRVARCESGLNPRAVNWRDVRGGSVGLFQINGTHGPGGYATEAWVARMMIPRHNIAFAWKLSRGGTRWGPWACY